MRLPQPYPTNKVKKFLFYSEALNIFLMGKFTVLVNVFKIAQIILNNKLSLSSGTMVPAEFWPGQ